MPYYAVLEGRNPGVYDNWQDCKEQVFEYSGCELRKFYSEEDALRCVCYGDEYMDNVFVDGACRGNGRHYWPSAGYGVYYGPDDDRNVAIALSDVDPDIKPTNQRAELLALLHALRNIKSDLSWSRARCPVRILSDSQYAVKSFNIWSDNWRNNGWRNNRGTTISNVDLIREMVLLKDSINKHYNWKNWDDVEVKYIQGHSGNLANEEADRLANLGADHDS